MTITTQTAEHIAREHFDIHASASALDGEIDRNFHLRADDGAQYVLKISRATQTRESLDLQTKVLLHVQSRAPQAPIQHPLKAKNGDYLIARDDTTTARVVTFLDGRLLANSAPHNAELMRDLGRVLAQIDHALVDFEHPAAHRWLKWDLAQANWIGDELDHLDAPQRTLVEQLFAHYRAIEPLLSELPQQVIHNDANDYNIVVSGKALSERRVSGIIDFGDALYTQRVNEVAIACAYALLDKPDPIATAAEIVRGYHAQNPFAENEIAALYGLICARLCVSVVNSAIQKQREPDNTYLAISEKPAWAAMERLVTVHPNFAHYMLRDACGWAPCPTSPRVVQWLTDHAGEIGALFAPDIRTAKLAVSDWSVGSTELGSPQDFFDTPKLTRQMWQRMRDENLTALMGAWNSPRPIYGSDAFVIQSNDGPVWRTVHIGMDTFMDAETPIYAPLDGVVHSFRNNAVDFDYGPCVVLKHTVDNDLTFYTLYGHNSLDTLDGLFVGKLIRKGERVAKIGNYPINGNWPPHLHFQIICDMLGFEGDFYGSAKASERNVWLSISPDANLIQQTPAELWQNKPPSIEELSARRKERIGRNLSVSYQKPLHIVRGYMQRLYDADGRRYLDSVNNVAHVGHCHPRVVAAAQKQMAVLNTNTRYLHESLLRYADRLCATLPSSLSVVYLTCSGSEANELALRLARAHTRQRDVIISDGAYHGNTQGLIEISPYKFNSAGGTGKPATTHIAPMPDVYRMPRTGAAYAQLIQHNIDRIHALGRGLSAFMIESILSCGGQIVLPDGYLAEAYRLVRAAGGVCIADEVQTGFGRVGSHFWAFEMQSVTPDIVVMGKPIGNGHPMGAVVCTTEIADSFNNGMEYFNTFGGNAVSCAIGEAVLDVIRDEGLQAHAAEVGDYFLAQLRQLQSRHAIIGDVRGVGLFLGFELVRDRATLEPAAEAASYVANRMREMGVLASTDGPLHNVIKIKPPMQFNQRDVDLYIACLDKALQEDFVK